jgi:hypothetical protein
LIVIVGGWVTTPTVSSWRRGRDDGNGRPGSEFLSSSVGRKGDDGSRDERDEQERGERGPEPDRGVAPPELRVPPADVAPGRRRPHSRQYSW